MVLNMRSIIGLSTCGWLSLANDRLDEACGRVQADHFVLGLVGPGANVAAKGGAGGGHFNQFARQHRLDRAVGLHDRAGALQAHGVQHMVVTHRRHQGAGAAQLGLDFSLGAALDVFLERILKPQ
jgi:hypothetical protein